MAVKVLLMWNSKITINDGGDNIDTSSVLEVRNLAVLRVRSFTITTYDMITDISFFIFPVVNALVLFHLQGNSAVSSNANLALYGQGLLTLTGPGDVIRAQRLSLSLFYNVSVRFHHYCKKIIMSKVVIAACLNSCIFVQDIFFLSSKAFSPL